jgi:hypothetical protein
MFAPPIAKLRAKTAARSTNKLAPHRSTLVAQFRGSAGDSAPVLQRGLDQRRSQPERSKPGINAHEQEARGLGDPEHIPLREAAGPSWDFSKISIFPPDQQPSSAPVRLQPKLAIGAINDPLEHEADRVADRVMRMSAPGVSVTVAPPEVSRKCDACEEEEGKLQKKEAGPAGPALGEAPASVHEVLRSQGQPLDAATRAYFEPRFGQDFGRVRVHSDVLAKESARSVNALAYTVGQDVVFGTGQYAPETMAGRKLLAHELAHVIQQEHSTNPTKLTIGPSESVLEQQGNRATVDVGVGRIAADVSPSSTSGLVQRQAPAAEPEPAAEPVGGVPTSRLYPVDPNSSAAEYERSQRYGVTMRAEASSRANPIPVIREGGAPPDFITKSDRPQAEGLGESGIIRTETYEFHVPDAIEYWTERAANDEEIIMVLRSYMPDVLPALEPHAEPALSEPLLLTPLLPTPVDESLIKTVDPGGKYRRAAWSRGLEKRKQRLAAKVLTEAENVALGGKKRKEGRCDNKPNAHKGGSDEHDRYANYVGFAKGYGPVDGELTWTTPEGVSYSFDTYNPKDKREVWEVKTQHEWASPLGMATAPYRVPDFSTRIADIEVQRLKGLYIANRCGLSFKYAFDNCSAYTGFRQQWVLPPIEYIPYPGEIKVDCQ